MWRSHKTLVIFVLHFLCITNGPLTVYGEDRLLNEYQVKAAFLLNFAKFVEWPQDAFAGPEDPLILAVLGEDPFGDALGSMKGRLINGRKILVNRYKDVRDIRACHVLFISSSEQESLASVLRYLRNSKILVVGDMVDFAMRGGVINFIIEDKKMGFEINIDAARRAGLTISSKLLSLAKIIHDSPEGENN